MKVHRVKIDLERCRKCNFCQDVFSCPSPNRCIGCLACVDACPYMARVAIEVEEQVNLISIYIDGVKYEVSDRITVSKALSIVGLNVDTPCRVGGCWSCMVLINGEPKRSCITPVEDGMKISLNVEEVQPLRIVHGPEPHTIGGKGTPWWQVDYRHYVEAAIWVAGCNLRCPQCQNYHVTYDNTSKPMTPYQAARLVTKYRIIYGTQGVAISGGEPTLNRKWLIEYFKELSRLNPPDIRLHLDSNGTLLTRDYIDKLVEVGCNNIGVEPKTYSLESYMKVTGVKDRDLAKKYHETSWSAIKYLVDNYMDKVYIGVGLIYNSALVSLDEIYRAGLRIAKINPDVQVTVLDYFPTFRRRDIKRPSPKEMIEVKKILEEAGLKTVIVQTSIGHIGPGNRNINLVK